MITITGPELPTFTPPESSPSGQFWGIYALIGGVRVKENYRCARVLSAYINTIGLVAFIRYNSSAYYNAVNNSSNSVLCGKVNHQIEVTL